MSVRVVSQSDQQFNLSLGQAIEKFSTMLPGIARNVAKIAFPTACVFVLSNIPGVEAPGLAYLSCLTICSMGCSFATGGIGTPACIASCAAACSPAVPISIIL